MAERYVYFIRGDITGRIKIGSSWNPLARMRSLAMCASEPMSLLMLLSEQRMSESEAHKLFAEQRIHGEWFAPCILDVLSDAGIPTDDPIAQAGYVGRKFVLTVRRDDNGWSD